MKEETKKEVIKEIEEMMFEEPKCDFEHIYNMTLEKVIINVETF